MGKDHKVPLTRFIFHKSSATFLYSFGKLGVRTSQAGREKAQQPIKSYTIKQRKKERKVFHFCFTIYGYRTGQQNRMTQGSPRQKGTQGRSSLRTRESTLSKPHCSLRTWP
jgi:hypothetical protein